MHPVVNVKGPKTKFLRSSTDSYRVSMDKRPNTALHSSWNWELISDKPLDWWLPRLRRIKDAFPHKVLVASIMAGSEDDKEVNHWRELAVACQEQGVDAFELNLSCPHMDRVDMGSNIGKNVQLIDTVVRAVKEVARKPVWVKLTPTTTNIAKEAEAAFKAGADAISSSNTFTSLPPIDPESLEFEVNVEGKVSYGGLGGPAILPLSLAKMAQMTTAFPDEQLLRHRRHLGVLAGAELLPARVRHGAGLHRGDAGSRDRPERDQGAAVGNAGVPREARRQGLAFARRHPRPPPRPHRRALRNQAAGEGS